MSNLASILETEVREEIAQIKRQSQEKAAEIVNQAAIDAHRRVQMIEKRMQAADHPVLLGVPETYYLKCVIARRI